MKIGVTGHRGRIGSRLIALGAVPLDCDVTDELAVLRELRYKKPDIVVHAASIASIAECEKNNEKAISVNMLGTNILCEEADKIGVRIVNLSTEQVFDGQKGMYSEEDEPNPINNYGRSKLVGELVSKLYGAKTIRLSRGISREKGKDIDNYINDLEAGKEVFVPDFIVRSYSHLDFLAEGIWKFARNFESMPALLHLGGSLPLSFYELIATISEEMRIDPSLVVRRKTEIKDNPRPFNCGFDVSLARDCGLITSSPLTTITRLRNEYALV